ncbi:MAG: IclR family transcriptional regulator [Micrococcales bacterium]|nr:IclR family transcriptional regulator [Micrococcales bacterium]
MGESLSSVRNAVRVLKAFSSRRRDYGVTELARALGMTTSTVHRLLRTLQSEHLVEQDPETGRYRLGLAVYDLVAASSPGYDLSEAVLPPMTMLRNRTGETTQLAVLDGREVVYVERLQSMHSLRMFLDVGRRNWAHSTSTGKVLLAHLEPSVLDRTLEGWDPPSRTPFTVTDLAVLRRQLAQIRHQGWAHNVDESEIGATSIGAPVRDVSGQVVAALSVVGPSPRMDQDLAAIRQAVVEAAAVASRRLGHRGRGVDHAS